MFLLCLVANPIPETAIIVLMAFCSYFRRDVGIDHVIGVRTDELKMREDESAAQFLVRYYNDVGGEPSDEICELLQDGVPTACCLSIATCLLLIICAKQQTGPTAQTYMSRRITAFERTFALTCPEIPILRNMSNQSFINDVTRVARGAPKLVASLFDIVVDLSASSDESVSRPAVTTMSLVAFSQMTPVVLALRFALTVPGMDEISELTIELKRLATGLAAIESTNERLEYARLRDLPGAGLLAGKSLPNLSTIGKRIAIQLEGERWAQVKLPAGTSDVAIMAGMHVYGLHTTKITEMGPADADQEDDED